MPKITHREQRLFETLVPIVEPLGVSLLDLELQTHERDPVIRLVIAREDGPVGTRDCQEVTEHVSPVLSLEDLGFEGGYDLEVTTPGVERRLRRDHEYDRFADREVVVNCFGSYRDRKRWKGVLKGRTDEVLMLDVDGERIEIPREQVASTRLYFDPEAALRSEGRSLDG